METKKCSKCGEVKALDAFFKDRKWLRTTCRACDSLKRAAYREVNKEMDKEYQSAYLKNHREQSRATKRARYKNNPEPHKAAALAFHHANPEKMKEKAAAYYRNNLDRILEKKSQHADVCSDGYVALALRLPLADCPPELIALKREQLQIYRLTKQLNQAIKDAQK